MKSLRLILPDQISMKIASLKDIDAKNDLILLCENRSDWENVPHHQIKLAFIFSAMRHFAAALKKKGYQVQYIALDDPDNQNDLTANVKNCIQQRTINQIIVTHPGEYETLKTLQQWQRTLSLPVKILEDDRFLISPETFVLWSENKKNTRMEHFYRKARKKYDILMNADGKPTGGKWNYDKDNRKPLSDNIKIPKRKTYSPSRTTQQVFHLVEKHFPKHFGSLENFRYAVTREDALKDLNFFIKKLLPCFGDYQDAMQSDEPFLFHSLISAYLNIGLLTPLEVIQKAEQAYRDKACPINAAEGFIRQILGWREFVRGVYWTHMPSYAKLNALNAKSPLPHFYWDAKTSLFCVSEVVKQTLENAYSHHIQRLMVTGNFALLAGIDVKAVQDWYLAVYADAFEWVEMPNTLGMALYGDEGIMGSKPYAASGHYIDRMSNFCQNCQYHPKKMLEDNACPFNALYWDFMARNETKLSKNPRLFYAYQTLKKMAPQKKQAIRKKAKAILTRLKENTL